jgi:hypothetical protein
LEYDYFQNLFQGLYPSEEQATAAQEWQEKWVSTAGIFQSALLFQFIVLLMWIYRINSNTRSLGAAADMKYTPGWSVGWFFIPIANIWKPYQVLKELWISNHPSHIPVPDKKKGAKFIGWFWAIALISIGLDKVALKMSFRAKELPELIQTNYIMLLSDFIDIPFYILSIILVQRIYTLQMAKFAPHAHDYSQLIRAVPMTQETEKKKTRAKWIRRCLLTLLSLFIITMVILLFFTWLDIPIL